MKLLIPIILLNLCFAQEVPTQADIAKENIHRFFPDIPKHYFKNFFYSIRARDYDFLLQNHFDPNVYSPFNVFKGDSKYLTPTKDAHPSFANQDYYFEDIAKTGFGVCSGLTYLMRKFHHLSFYDPFNKLNESIPLEGKDPEGWFQFYKEKIDNVIALKPAIFPGFKNFNELSAHPVLGEYLKELTLGEWVVKNLTVAGLTQLTSIQNKKIFSLDVDELYHDLKFRLSLGYKPIIYASKHRDTKFVKEEGWSALFDKEKLKDFKGKIKKLKDVIWIHVLNVYDIRKIDSLGSFEIMTWDINTVHMEDVPRKIIIKANGKIEGDFKGVGYVDLYPHDDFEIGQIVMNKLEWCSLNKIHKSLCKQRKLEF